MTWRSDYHDPMIRHTRALALLLWTLAALSSSAFAHGPTVKVSYSGIRPSELVVEAGTTLHFHNANAGGGVCTLVGEDGAFESPPLNPGEGWHHTFENPGTFRFHVKEFSRAKGMVRVGPKP